MANVTVHVEGLSDLLKNMRDLNNKVKRKIIRSGALAGARVIERAVEAKAPVRTGELKARISTRRSRKYSSTDKGYEQRDIGVFKIKGGKFKNTARNRKLGRVGDRLIEQDPAFYWRFQEFGTVRMSAHPFLRPGFDASKQQAVSATVDKLKTEIAKATK